MLCIKKSKIEKDILEGLSPEDALNVLTILLRESPDLTEKIDEIILRILCDINCEDIVSDVFDELSCLDVHDLWARSGATRYGYVDPADESWVMFEEALGSFLSEIKKYQERGMKKEAKEYCIGLIRGIKKYKKESNSDFLDWAPDAPEESIHIVISEWKKGNPSAKDITDVMKVAAEN